MKNYFLWRNRVPITGAVLLLISAHFLWSGVLPDQRAARPRGLVMEALAPLQVAAARLADGGASIFHDYFDLVGVQRENARLRAELAREETQRARLAELEAENLHLSDMLELKQALALNSAAANVIGGDASGLARTLVLAGGAGQGFEAGMAVLSTEGVVGKLIAVGPSSSRVLLINDHNSALDAFDQRSRVRGIVAGVVDDGLVMKYVDRSEDVKSGDTIVTSGLDGIFPRGLLVGEVTSVVREGPGLFLTVNIAPAADFRRLEQVLVITQRMPQPPPAGPKS
ncbi:MAG TPA: rod shape-determining protein MreC [Candidatus Binataceae bacterium]|nr:rod shape-determining protein MreC [Candidatus Binataceae bacterium]